MFISIASVLRRILMAFNIDQDPVRKAIAGTESVIKQKNVGLLKSAVKDLDSKFTLRYTKLHLLDLADSIAPLNPRDKTLMLSAIKNALKQPEISPEIHSGLTALAKSIEGNAPMDSHKGATPNLIELAWTKLKQVIETSGGKMDSDQEWAEVDKAMNTFKSYYYIAEPLVLRSTMMPYIK